MYLSLGKGRGPSIEQIGIPFTQGCFVSRLVEITGLFSCSRNENGKINVKSKDFTEFRLLLYL